MTREVWRSGDSFLSLAIKGGTIALHEAMYLDPVSMRSSKGMNIRTTK